MKRDDINVEAVKYQIIVQGDDGDELWEADSDYETNRGKARLAAKTMLRFGRRMVTQPPEAARDVELIAYIYEGKMVNVGDETDEDWVFESDPAIQAEIVH
jgi:hypothetical protein